MQIYARLRKIAEDDDGTLEVEGIASTEAVDKSGEIVKAAAIKAALPNFMADGSGPLREMHQFVAAGKVVEAMVDALGRTLIRAIVVDANAVKKIQTGVLKGFSIGGKVLARDAKNAKIITKLALTEISLVDAPCNSEATLTLWKADGLYDRRPVSDHMLALRKSDETAERAMQKIETSLAELAALEKRLALVERFDAAARRAAEQRWVQ